MSEIFAPYSGQGPLGGINPVVLARAQFLTWLKGNNPGLFYRGLRIAEADKARFVEQTGNPAALSGLGGEEGTTPTTWWQSFAEGITGAGTAYLAYKGQKAAIDANMRRAEQGLPPLDYSGAMAPTIRTQVGVSPEILARLQEGAGFAGNLLLYGAIGLGAFFLLKNLTRR